MRNCRYVAERGRSRTLSETLISAFVVDLSRLAGFGSPERQLLPAPVMAKQRLYLDLCCPDREVHAVATSLRKPHDGKKAVKTSLTDEERKELESLGRNHRTLQACHTRIVLAAELTGDCGKTEDDRGDGQASGAAAERRLDGLHDEPCPGKSRRIGDVADVIRWTRNAAGRDPLKLRSMSRAVRPSIASGGLPPETPRDLQAGHAVRREGAAHCERVPRPAGAGAGHRP